MAFPAGFTHYDQMSGKFKHECEMCGTQILSRRRTGVKFCSPKCRKRASNGHSTWVTEFVCVVCGSLGETSQPFQNKKYCSNACKQRAYRSRL